MRFQQIFFSIAFIEGYAVLAAELIAIRILASHAGNGTDVVAIIAAAVLLPLSFGYYVGSFTKSDHSRLFSCTIRERLINNFLISCIILTFGLATPVVDLIFEAQRQLGASSRYTMTACYALLVLVIPCFMLGQTLPLISSYFRGRPAATTAGRLLFWSTLGAFCGSIISTIAIMPWLGVPYAALMVTLLLAIGGFMLAGFRRKKIGFVFFLMLVFSLFLNSEFMSRVQGLKYQNAFNNVRILSHKGDRLLMLNNAPSTRHLIRSFPIHFVSPPMILVHGKMIPPRAI